MYFVLALTSFITAVLAAGRTTAPKGAITVGSSGNFTKIQDAINSIDATAKGSIFILPGIYKEKIVIGKRTGALTIYGYTEDKSSYSGNKVTISNSYSQLDGALSNKATATVANSAQNTKFYNINIENTYGKGSQAVALAAYNTSQGYYGVGLYGYQDTLLTEIGNQVYAKCYIKGATDFIFGQTARTWIDGSVLAVSGPGYITANGRDSASNPSYYVINKSTISAAFNASVAAGKTFLGRPWRNYSRVCFQNTEISDIVNGAGWTTWTRNDSRTDQVTYEEFGNTGPGAKGNRSTFATKRSSPVKIAEILGSDYKSWVDRSYLS